MAIFEQISSSLKLPILVHLHAITFLNIRLSYFLAFWQNSKYWLNYSFHQSSAPNKPCCLGCVVFAKMVCVNGVPYFLKAPVGGCLVFCHFILNTGLFVQIRLQIFDRILKSSRLVPYLDKNWFSHPNRFHSYLVCLNNDCKSSMLDQL